MRDEQRKGCRAHQGNYISGGHVLRGNLWGFLKASLFVVTSRGRKYLFQLARMFHELLSRDREDDRANWQPQGVGPEAYLNGTTQGATPEDARKDGYILGRSK